MCPVKYVICRDITSKPWVKNMATKCLVNPEALLRALHRAPKFCVQVQVKGPKCLSVKQLIKQVNKFELPQVE